MYVRGTVFQYKKMGTYIRHKVSSEELLLVEHDTIFVVVRKKPIAELVYVLEIEEALYAI